ncbi:MAG TPA: acyl carrier protein [Longimicrobium sp.]|nr:acyl carrier protein [Longimicrobium sp.]
MYDELTQRVIAHIAQVHAVPADDITPESTFEELDIDSLGAMSLVADLEIEMGVEVPNEELLKIKTVGQAADSLARVLAGAGAAGQVEAAAAPQA